MKSNYQVYAKLWLIAVIMDNSGIALAQNATIPLSAPNLEARQDQIFFGIPGIDQADIYQDIKNVIEGKESTHGMKSAPMKGGKIDAVPFQTIWTDKTSVARQKLIVSQTYKAVMNVYSKMLTPDSASVFNNLPEEALNVVGAEVKAIQGVKEISPEVAKKYSEIVTKLLAENKEEGLNLLVSQQKAFADMSAMLEIYQERILNADLSELTAAAQGLGVDSKKVLAFLHDGEVSKFVPGAFGIQIGFQVSSSLKEVLNTLPGIGKYLSMSDGSGTLSFLLQPWDVTVTDFRGLQTKYTYVQLVPHLWLNRSINKGAINNFSKSSLRFGLVAIFGSVVDLKAYHGIFGGESSDVNVTGLLPRSRLYVDGSPIQEKVFNIKFGALGTTKGGMNAYAMIGWEPGRGKVPSNVNNEIPLINRLKSRMNTRRNVGWVVPLMEIPRIVLSNLWTDDAAKSVVEGNDPSALMKALMDRNLTKQD